jgi:hypothetical protein
LREGRHIRRHPAGHRRRRRRIAIVVIVVVALLALVLAYGGIRMLGRTRGYRPNGPVGCSSFSLCRRRALVPGRAGRGRRSRPPAPHVRPRDTSARPSEPLAALEHTARECLPLLFGLSEGVRLLALDLSADNLDFVQESAGVRHRFVRVSCRYDGSGYQLFEAGRMVVPPAVGDAAALPAAPLDRRLLTPGWFVERVRAAQADAGVAAQPRRLEASWVDGYGALSRVSFDAAALVPRVVLDVDGRPLAPDTPFPQVERLTEVSEAAAARDYRDLGQTIWSVGVAETVERMMRVQFDPEQPLHALEIERFRIALIAPAGASAQRIVVDEYGDRSEPTPSALLPHHCRRLFSLRAARAALDDATVERGETLAQFERHEFVNATLA